MSTGQLVSRANSDSALVQGLLNMLPIMSGNVILMVLSLVVMFFLSPLLALVSLVMLPLLVFVAYRMRTRVLPGELGRPAEGGRGRPDRRRGHQRRARGQGVRPGVARDPAHRGCLDPGSTAPSCAPCASSRATSRVLEAIPTLGQVADPRARRLAHPRARLSIGTFLAFSAYVAAPRRPRPTARRRADDRPARSGRHRANLPAARPAAGHRGCAGRGRPARRPG